MVLIWGYEEVVSFSSEKLRAIIDDRCGKSGYPETLTDLVTQVGLNIAARALSEGVGLATNEARQAHLADLDYACITAVRFAQTSDNYMIGAYVASMRSIIERFEHPVLAGEIAHRAVLFADLARQQVARFWGACANGLVALQTNQPLNAIRTLEYVVELGPERGTLKVFALTILAEAYAEIGNPEAAANALDRARFARDQVREPDEFGGSMAFPLEQETDHAARTYLKLGDYSRALEAALFTRDTYTRMPVRQRREAYFASASNTAARAAIGLGHYDQATEYASGIVELSFLDRDRIAALTADLKTHSIAPDVSDALHARFLA